MFILNNFVLKHTLAVIGSGEERKNYVFYYHNWNLLFANEPLTLSRQTILFIE